MSESAQSFLQDRLSFLWPDKFTGFQAGTPWMGLKSVKNGVANYLGIGAGCHVFADERVTRIWMYPGNFLPMEESTRHGVVLGDGAALAPEGFRRVVVLREPKDGLVKFQFEKAPRTLPYQEVRDFFLREGFEVSQTGFGDFVNQVISGEAPAGVYGRSIFLSAGLSAASWENARFSSDRIINHVQPDGSLSVYKVNELRKFFQAMSVVSPEVRKHFSMRALHRNPKDRKAGLLLDRLPESRYLQQAYPVGFGARQYIKKMLEEQMKEAVAP